MDLMWLNPIWMWMKNMFNVYKNGGMIEPGFWKGMIPSNLLAGLIWFPLDPHPLAG